MSKINCIRLLAALVSIGGLTSCKKDGGPSPTAHKIFPPPTVVRQNTTYDLEAWGHEFNRDLGLGETIELGTPAPPFSEIHTTCGTGPGARTFRATFKDVSSLPIFKFVPEEVLAQDLKTTPADCHFIIQMGMDQSFRNGFEMVAQINADHGDIRMHGRGIPTRGRPKLRTKDLLGHKINYPVHADSEAQLICGDLTFPKVSFGGDLDLNMLSVDQPRLRDEHLAQQIVDEHPEQLCRVVVSDRSSKTREEMTGLFTLQFNKQKWRAIETDDTSTLANGMAQGQNLKLATYVIKNLEDDPRRLRFNRDWYATKLSINPRLDHTAVATVNGPAWARVFRDGPLQPEWQRAGEAFVIPPHGEAKFTLMYTVGGDIHCDPLRTKVLVTDEIYLQELTDGGDVIGGAKLTAPPELTKQVVNFDFAFDDSKQHPWEICHW